MAVIKCSNCENEILDSEIVCPYCDCPISETFKKIKFEEKIAEPEPEINDAFKDTPLATSLDFEKEKAAILKDLDIKITADNSGSDNSDNSNDTEDTEHVISGVSTEKTVKISRDEIFKQEKDNREESARNETQKNVPVKKVPSRKKLVKKRDSKPLVLAVTIAGVIVIIALVWGLIDQVAGIYSKKEKPNKTVKVTDSSAQSDAQFGFELHSSTLTITDDEVMIDYDSPDQTPWFKDKNKIKHVTFGKNVTRIGAHSFEGFTKITDINISDSVIEIGESAFCNCTSLTKITNMSKNIEEIDDYAFTGCKKLSKIPGYTEEADFEPMIERIGVEAFKSCKALEAFKVPIYTEIDTDAFYGHGDEFALVCESDSKAYKYAEEKGIPTKLSFDDEATEHNEENTPDTSAPSGTTPPATSSNEPAKQEPSGNNNNENSNNSSGNNQNNESTENNPTSNEPSGSDNPGGNTSEPSEAPELTKEQKIDILNKKLQSATSQDEIDSIILEMERVAQE